MRKEVTLYFPTIDALWAFRKEIRPSFFEMNPRKKIFTCQCSEDQIKLANLKYKASVVTNQQPTTQ